MLKRKLERKFPEYSMAQNKYYNIGDLFKIPPLQQIERAEKGAGRKYAKKSHEKTSTRKRKARG